MVTRTARTKYVSEILTVIDHIHRHPANDLSLLALSRLTTLSPHHFHKVFKSMYEENLYDYIRRMRIDLAARRLLFYDLSLTPSPNYLRSCAAKQASFVSLYGTPK